MKILINCYACSPYRGSEPGMGWNFVKCLSRHHELHIITNQCWSADIGRYFDSHPEERPYYHFHFLPRRSYGSIERFPPAYYWGLDRWQRDALRLARILDQTERFDLTHQLNMIGYRSPGYFWKLGKPHVWGPIGGFNNVPWRLLPILGARGGAKYLVRNLLNIWQMHTSLQVRRAIDHSACLISATQIDQRRIAGVYGRDSLLLPEVGLYGSVAAAGGHMRQPGEPLRLCWSGLHIHRKALGLLIEAMALCRERENIRLEVIGHGECTEKWRRQAERLGLGNITWHGWVDMAQAHDIMRQADVFVITSLADATSTVLLEALSFALPVIALDHLGFANVVNERCGVKITVNTHSGIVAGLARAIDRIEANEKLRRQLSRGARERAEDFAWDKKADIICGIYNKVSTGLTQVKR